MTRQSERIFPVVIRSLSFPDEGALFRIEETCPACGHVDVYSNGSDFRPWQEDGDTSWRCGACGALRMWNSLLARDQIWRHFDALLNAFTENDQGELEAEDAAWIRQKASALESIAPVYFLHYEAVIGHIVLKTGGLLQELLTHEKCGAFLCYLGILDSEAVNESFAAIAGKTFLSHLFDLQCRIRYYKHSAQITQNNCYSQNSLPNLPLVDYLYEKKLSNGFVFSRNDTERAHQELEKMGVPPDARIACLLVRDGEYHQYMDTHHGAIPERMLYGVRDANIETYRAACEYLTEEGYYILRMGYKVRQAISWGNDRIIDYASLYRSAFMDIWLFCHCDICITTGTGQDLLSTMRYSPTVITNFVHPFNNFMKFGPVVMLYKKFCNAETGKILSMQEFFERGTEISTFYGNVLKDASCPSDTFLDLSIRDNTEDEILDAVKELIEMLTGAHTPTAFEEEQQRKFYTLDVNPFYKYGYCSQSRLARTMLRTIPIYSGS